MFLSHLASRKFMVTVLIFFTFAMSVFKCFAIAEENGKESYVKCNIHDTSCTQLLPNCTVTLDIKPKPVKAMTDLCFTVILSGKKPTSNPYIDLEMPGMKMGPNQVKLESVGNNTYSGRGIIVRCPSGRRTWKAAVVIPDVGTAEFIFDVVY